MTSAADRLILVAATGVRSLTEDELDRVVEHIASAGFDAASRERAGGRLAGLVWRGRTLRAGDLLPPATTHYLRHVVVQREWPDGTTLDGYLTSARAVIESPSSGVMISRYASQVWQVAIVRRSGDLRGPNGGDWVLVEYRVETGYWVTALQPAAGLPYLDLPNREQKQWLRQPSELGHSSRISD